MLNLSKNQVKSIYSTENYNEMVFYGLICQKWTLVLFWILLLSIFWIPSILRYCELTWSDAYWWCVWEVTRLGGICFTPSLHAPHHTAAHTYNIQYSTSHLTIPALPYCGSHLQHTIQHFTPHNICLCKIKGK